MNLRCPSVNNKRAARDVYHLGASWCSGAKKPQVENFKSCDIQLLHSMEPQRLWSAANLLQKVFENRNMDCQENFLLPRHVQQKLKAPCLSKGNSFWMKPNIFTMQRCFNSGAENDHKLTRSFLAQLWIADRKIKRLKEKKRLGTLRYTKPSETTFEQDEPYPKQPPVSQSMAGFLKPESPEEVKVAPLLARSNLLITRDIEWANLVLGFEQENRYVIVDACYPQGPVGTIREKSNIVARQFLRLRRPFVAYVADATGNERFRVRRPFWWINSSIYVEIDGKEVGVVHRRWHLWRRVYDLYLGQSQFAVVENPGFWNWTFTLKDIDGEILAQIDRDWRGFGFEILTDAGQYVIRFGNADPSSKTGLTNEIEELDVKRPLTLSERAVAVALAISLDNDYFSRHSGMGLPFIAVGE